MYPFLKKLFADGGYQGPDFQKALARILPQLETEIVKRSDRTKGFVVLPRRWIVERTFAWLNRCRRLAKDWENLNRNALAFLRLASIRLCSENFVIPPDVFGQTLRNYTAKTSKHLVASSMARLSWWYDFRCPRRFHLGFYQPRFWIFRWCHYGLYCWNGLVVHRFAHGITQ